MNGFMIYLAVLAVVGLMLTAWAFVANRRASKKEQHPIFLEDKAGEL